MNQFKGRKLKGSKYYWTTKQIEPFRKHPSTVFFLFSL